MNDEKETLFTKEIKPYCVRLIKYPNADNVNALIGVLTHLSVTEIQSFQEYLVFPLMHILKLKQT